MQAFTIYSAQSGQIERNIVGGSLAEAQMNAGAGHIVVEGCFRYHDTYFDVSVTPHLPRVKTEIGARISGAIISNLPIPCDVVVNGAPPVTVTTGSYVVDKPAGKYFVLLRSTKFLDTYELVTISA